jgi:hypothetical protein
VQGPAVGGASTKVVNGRPVAAVSVANARAGTGPLVRIAPRARIRMNAGCRGRHRWVTGVLKEAVRPALASAASAAAMRGNIAGEAQDPSGECGEIVRRAQAVARDPSGECGAIVRRARAVAWDPSGAVGRIEARAVSPAIAKSGSAAARTPGGTVRRDANGRAVSNAEGPEEVPAGTPAPSAPGASLARKRVAAISCAAVGHAGWGPIGVVTPNPARVQLQRQPMLPEDLPPAPSDPDGGGIAKATLRAARSRLG